MQYLKEIKKTSIINEDIPFDQIVPRTLNASLIYNFLETNFS